MPFCLAGRSPQSSYLKLKEEKLGTRRKTQLPLPNDSSLVGRRQHAHPLNRIAPRTCWNDSVRVDPRYPSSRDEACRIHPLLFSFLLPRRRRWNTDVCWRYFSSGFIIVCCHGQTTLNKLPSISLLAADCWGSGPGDDDYGPFCFGTERWSSEGGKLWIRKLWCS